MNQVYLAGPMSGYQDHNFPAFYEASNQLRLEGFVVVSPAEMDLQLGFDPTAGGPDFLCIPEGAMQRDLHAVTNPENHGIVLLPGWAKSKGTRKELRAAIWCDLAVYLINPLGYGDRWWLIDATAFAAEMLEQAEQDARESETPDVPSNTTEEVRIVSDTGGAKGRKDARFGLIPTEPMWEVARCYGIGAEKYADWNWALGYPYSLSIDALERHLNLWKQGEKIDEAGFHHLSAVVFHALTLMDREIHAPEFDDRRDIYRNDSIE